MKATAAWIALLVTSCTAACTLPTIREEPDCYPRWECPGWEELIYPEGAP